MFYEHPEGLLFNRKRLARARVAAGYLRQSVAARALGVTRQVVNNHEQGWSRPSLEHMALYAKTYGVRMEDFYT